MSIPDPLPLTPHERDVAFSLARVIHLYLPPDDEAHHGNSLEECPARICRARVRILASLAKEEGDDV